MTKKTYYQFKGGFLTELEKGIRILQIEKYKDQYFTNNNREIKI